MRNDYRYKLAGATEKGGDGMKPWWRVIFMALGLLALSAIVMYGRAEAEGLAKVNPEKFLQMSLEDQILYTDGVLDTLLALSTEKLIPKEAALCFRTTNYGELIGGVNSYLYKARGSEDLDVKKAVTITPVSIWIVRLYWEKCNEKSGKR